MTDSKIKEIAKKHGKTLTKEQIALLKRSLKLRKKTDRLIIKDLKKRGL